MKEKRRLSILKLPPEENSKPIAEKKQRVSFGTANQLITYSNPDSQKKDSSTTSYRKESVPFNDAKEHSSLPKRPPLGDITKKTSGSLKSAAHSFIDRFLSNPAELFSDDENSTMEITGSAISDSFLQIGQQTSHQTPKPATAAQPHRYSFESPASEGLGRAGKRLSTLLGDDEDSVSSLLEKTDEDELFDEKTQPESAFDGKRPGATEEQTLMYINLQKKGDKQKGPAAFSEAGDKMCVSGVKYGLDEVLAFLEFREDSNKAHSEKIIEAKGKPPVSNKNLLVSPTKNEREIFESIFINGLEKRELFSKAIKDLSSKVNESLKSKEDTIQSIVNCGNEGERPQNKFVNLMLNCKENRNEHEKFKTVLKHIKQHETQKAQNQITQTKNAISKALILALKPNISRLEQILVDFNAKNSDLFNHKLDLSKDIKSFSNCRWAEVERSITQNFAEIAAFGAKKAELAEKSVKIAESSQSEQNLAEIEGIYSILCKKTGVVFAKRATDEATKKVSTNVLLARGTVKAEITSVIKDEAEMAEKVELLYGGEKKIINFCEQWAEGKKLISAGKKLMAEKMESGDKMARCSAMKCVNALGRADLLMLRMVDAFPWNECFKNNSDLKLNSVLEKLGLICEKMAALVYNLSKLYDHSVEDRNPLLFFANASALRETPEGFRNGCAYGHFWVVSKQSLQAHVWLNFSAIVVWLVPEKFFGPGLKKSGPGFRDENKEIGRFFVVEDVDLGVEKGAVDGVFERFDWVSGDVGELLGGIFAAVGVGGDNQR